MLWVVRIATTPQLPKPGTISLYANQCRDNLSHSLTAAISRANSSVYLTVYTLSEPAIIRALQTAARNGAEVHVITDKTQSGSLAKKLGPLIYLERRKPRGLMHRKIVIIDEAQVWLGSANFTFESLRVHGNLIAAFDSPTLARDLIDDTPQTFYDIAGHLVEYWPLPDKQAVQPLLNAIETAQSSLKIALFTWTRADITDAVIAAHNRGVHVEALIDSYQGRGCSKKTYDALTHAGITCHLSLGPELLHHKFALIDNQTLIVGSANWTAAAFSKNEDCFLLIHSLTPTHQKKLTKLWRILSLEVR